MAALCFTDKYDTVTVCVADANVRRFYGLALLEPGNFWSGFALCRQSNKNEVSAQRYATFKEFGDLPGKALRG